MKLGSGFGKGPGKKEAGRVSVLKEVSQSRGKGSGKKEAGRVSGAGLWGKGLGGNKTGKRAGLFSFGKEDSIKTGRFLLYFIVAYIALSLLAKAFFTVQGIELWVAGNVLGILQAMGQQGQVMIGESAFIELASGTSIEISELCTGLMETLIIAGAIIASVGISWRKRILGAAVSAVAAILFNHARIVFTVMAILGTEDIGLVEFAHNVLFRVVLFVVIAGLYIAWFYWAVSSEARGKKAKKSFA